VLRYYGRVDYTCAPALKRFTDGMLARQPCGGVVFDLSEAENLDSTNLGLLARVADRSRQQGGAKSVVVSSRDDINLVLGSMGFDQLVDIVPAGPTASGGRVEAEIRGEAPAAGELRQTMLEAHRTLVALSEAGRVQFEDVVACLESRQPGPG
jgi:anti-anti-sigma factor